jgi:hypothetical protein
MPGIGTASRMNSGEFTDFHGTMGGPTIERLYEELDESELDHQEVTKQLKSKYMNAVDFHHKIAFSFEKSYRMSKKPELAAKRA